MAVRPVRCGRVPQRFSRTNRAVLGRFRDCLGGAYVACWGLMVVTRVGMGEGHWPKRESGEPQS